MNRVCNVCDRPDTFERSQEHARIPCHVEEFSNHEFTVWRCSHCDSLHSLEDVELSNYYDGYPFKNHKLDFHARLGYANRLRMIGQVRREQTLLDYGCGVGLFLEFLRGQGFEQVAGYDAFVPAFASPSVLESRYDIVTAFDVLEHVAEPTSALRELFDLVKPGGRLVIGTPNASHIPLKRERGHFSIELSQPYHRHILSEKALLRLGLELGLTPERINHRFYFDTLVPGVNTRAMWEYINEKGGLIDVCVKPPDLKFILSRPRLLFYSFFGYFFPPRGNLLIVFRKPREEAVAAGQRQRA